MNFIPFVGSFIASVPPLILALLELGSAQAMVIGVGYLAINITFANIVEPRVFGKAVKLSPLAILLGVLFWGWVLGPVGALIAVPITTSAKLALQRNREWGWVAVMISAGTPEDSVE
ncbi:MAG: AI-2E family transporter [Myxococcota bacterium]